MLDINFRRLADNIRFFYKDSWFGVKFARLHIFQCGGVLSDLMGDDGSTWTSEEEMMTMDLNNGGLASHQTDLLDSLLVIRHPRRNLWREKNITKHISGLLENVYKLDYGQFKKKMYLNVKERPLIEIKNQDNIPILQYGTCLKDLYGNTLVKYENIYKYIS